MLFLIILASAAALAVMFLAVLFALLILESSEYAQAMKQIALLKAENKWLREHNSCHGMEKK